MSENKPQRKRRRHRRQEWAEHVKLVELLTHHARVDAQRFYKRLGFMASHVGMTVRF